MKTFNNVIQQLIDVNDKLIAGEIEIDIAKQVAVNTQVLVNAAKVQLEATRMLGFDKCDFFDQTLILPEPKMKEEPFQFSTDNVVCGSCARFNTCIKNESKRCVTNNTENFMEK